MVVITEKDAKRLKELEKKKNIKNKWNWKWMLKTRTSASGNIVKYSQVFKLGK